MSDYAIAIKLDANEAWDHLAILYRNFGISLRRIRYAIDRERLEAWRYFR